MSPYGDVFGIQSYDTGEEIRKITFKFDFITGEWSIHEKELQVQDIKFDRSGHQFILDTRGRIYAQGKTKPLLYGIKDFAVTFDGRIYAVKAEKGDDIFNVWNTTQGFDYYLVTPDYQSVHVSHSTPFYVDTNSRVYDLNNRCVADMSIGTDGAIWALDCIADKDGEYGVVRWDPLT